MWQVFEDKSGAIVVSFDRGSAVLEGDLSSYMQHMAKNHWLVSAGSNSFPHPYGVAGQGVPTQVVKLATECCHGCAQTAEYRLTKDGSQWGIEDRETQSVFYLFWPPWVRHR